MEKAAIVVYLRTFLLFALPLLISCQQINPTHVEHQDDPAHIDVDDPKWRLQLLNRFREVPPRNWPPFQRPPFPIEPPSLIEVPHNWPQQQPNAAQEERLQPQQINPETTGTSNNMGQLNEIPQPMDSRPPSPSKQEEKKPQRLEGVATSILVPLVPVHVDNFGNTVRLPFTFQLPPHQQQLRHPPLTDSRPMMPQRRIPPQVDNDNRFEEQKKVENLPNQQQQQQQPPFNFEQNRIFAPPNQNHRFNRQENFNNHPPPLFPPFNNRPFPPHPQQDSRLFPNNFEQSNNNFRRPPMQPPPNRLPQQQQEVHQKLFQQQQQLQQNSEKQRFQQEQVQEGSEQQHFQQVQQDTEQQHFQQQVQQDSEQQRFQQQPNGDQQNFQQQVQQIGEQQNFQQVQQNGEQQRFQQQQNSEQQNFQQQQPQVQQNSEQQRFQQLPQQDAQKKHFQQQLQQNGEQQRFQRQQQDNERQRFQRPQQDNERQRFQQQENERQRFQQLDSERENMQRQQLQQDGEQQRLQQQMQQGSEQRFRQNNIRQQRLQFQTPNNINNEGPNFDRNPNLIQSESAPPDWNQFHKNQSPLPEITNSLPPSMPNQQQQIPSHPPFGFHPPPRFPFPPRPPPQMLPPPQEMMPPRPPQEMMPPRPPQEMMPPRPPHEMMPPQPPHEMMPPQQMMPPPQQMPPPLPTRDVEVPKIFGDFPSEPKFDRSPWIPITPLPKVPHTPIVSPSREALRVEQPPPGPLSTTPSSQSIAVSVGKDFDVLSTTMSAQQENQEQFQAPNMIASSTSAPMAQSSQSSITIDQRNFIENPSNQAIDQGQNFIRMDFERETVSINQTDFNVGSIQQPDNANTSMLDDQPNRVRHLQPPEQFYPGEEIESSTAAQTTPPSEQQQHNRLESTPWTDNNVIVTSPPSLIEPLDNPTPQQPLEMSPELRQISVDQLYKHWKMQFGQGRDNNVEMPSTSSTTEAINHVISGPLNDQLSSFDIRQIDWSRRTTPAFTPSPDPQPMTPLPQFQQPDVEANTGFALTLSNRNRRRPAEETTTEYVTEAPASESFITPSVILQDKEHSTKTPDDVTKRPTGETRKVVVRRRKVLRKKVSKTTSPSTDLVNEYTHSSSDITTSP